MRRILVIEDREIFLDEIREWIKRNYPFTSVQDVTWVDDVDSLSNEYIDFHDIIIFSGMVGDIEITDKITVVDGWKNKLFVYQDNEIGTRKLLVQLKRAGIQIMKLVTYER
jgi:uncharacterized protein CbrC (UPF0167 family)